MRVGRYVCAWDKDTKGLRDREGMTRHNANTASTHTAVAESYTQATQRWVTFWGLFTGEFLGHFLSLFYQWYNKPVYHVPGNAPPGHFASLLSLHRLTNTSPHQDWIVTRGRGLRTCARAPAFFEFQLFWHRRESFQVEFFVCFEARCGTSITTCETVQHVIDRRNSHQWRIHGSRSWSQKTTVKCDINCCLFANLRDRDQSYEGGGGGSSCGETPWLSLDCEQALTLGNQEDILNAMLQAYRSARLPQLQCMGDAVCLPDWLHPYFPGDFDRGSLRPRIEFSYCPRPVRNAEWEQIIAS